MTKAGAPEPVRCKNLIRDDFWDKAAEILDRRTSNDSRYLVLSWSWVRSTDWVTSEVQTVVDEEVG